MYALALHGFALTLLMALVSTQNLSPFAPFPCKVNSTLSYRPGSCLSSNIPFGFPSPKKLPLPDLNSHITMDLAVHQKYPNCIKMICPQQWTVMYLKQRPFLIFFVANSWHYIQHIAVGNTFFKM